MGYWSCCIIGGDSQVDFMLDISDELIKRTPKDLLDKCENEDDLSLYPLECLSQLPVFEHWKELLPTLNFSEILGKEESFEIDGVEVSEIKEYQFSREDIQVIASIFMAFGAPISEERMAIFVEAGENDEWAVSGDFERKAYVDSYLDALKAYDGTPVFEASEGLFEKIFENLSGGMVDKKSVPNWLPKDKQ